MIKRNKMNFSLSRIMFILIMLIVVIVGGTFAWFTYSSKQSALVLTIGDINDTQIKLSPYQIKGTMTPVNTYTSGVYSEVEVTNGSGKSTSVTLYYRVNELDQELIDNGLKYTITSSSSQDGTYTEVKTGDFTEYNSSAGEELILDAHTEEDSTIYYRVYLWVDSSVGDQSAIQDSTLDVELNGSIGSVKITGENTYGHVLTASVTDSSATATYTYQWYSNTTNSMTGGVALTEATTDNTYTIGSGLAGKYIYVVTTAIEDYYANRIYTDITDVENNNTDVVDREDASLTVTPTTLNLTYPNTGTFSYTYTGDGTVSCSSADDSLATCSIDTDNKIVTVTPKTAGVSTTITLTATQGTNYKTIFKSVTVNIAEVEITISYESNGGSGSAPASHVAKIGSDVAIASNTFTKLGYTFAGWTTNSDGSNDGYNWTGWSGTWQYTNGQWGIENNKLILYAMWTANGYTVTVDAVGGTIPVTSEWTIASGSATATKSVTYASTYGALPTPTRSGYVFVGWFTEQTAGSQVTSSSKVTIASNHTLYAHWEDQTNPTVPTITTIYDLWGSRNYTYANYSSDAGTSGTWTTGDDPQIIFNDIGNIDSVTGAYIELSSALSQDIKIQVFYESGSSGFNATNSSSVVLLAAGETKMYIPITTGSWTKIRFDIGTGSGVSYKIKYLGVSATSGQWNNDAEILRVTSSDSGSGIKYWQYSYLENASENGTDDTTSWVTYSNSASDTFFTTAYSAQRNQNTYIRVCDAGENGVAESDVALPDDNCSSSTTLIKIDKTKPSVTDGIFTQNLWPTKSATGTNNLTISGTTIETTADDPYFYITGLSTVAVKKIIISFSSPLTQNDRFQVFYASSGTSWSETNSVKVTGYAGDKLLIMDMPGGSYGSFRIDLGTVGNVTYSGVSIDVQGEGISSSYYVHADIEDLHSGVAGYAVTSSSSTPSSFVSVSPAVDNYHVRYGVSSNTSYYVWGRDAAGSGNVSSSAEVSSDTVLYEISYDACSGSGAPSSQTKVSGSSLTLSSTIPTRTGYTFQGWSTAASCSAATSVNYKAGASYTTDASDTLYAVWKLNTYTVTTRHYLITGTNTYELHNEVTSTVNHGTTFSPSNVTAPTGYHAKNYFQYYDASGNELGSGTVGTNSFTVTQKTIVNVYYDLDTYTISYNANGGSGAPSSQTKTYGTDLTLSSTIPTRTGYSFLGWSISSTATSATYAAGGTYTSNASATLYAVWKVKTLVVTFMRNYSSSDTTKVTQTFTYGQTGQSFNSGFTRDGYTAKGWSYTQSGTTVNQSWTSGVSDGFIDKYSPSITLYAIWEESIVYLYNAGDQNTSLTGGWNSYASWDSEVTFNTSSIYLDTRIEGMYDHEDANNEAMIQTTNKVSITDYDKLKVTLSASLEGISGYDWGLYVGLSSVAIDSSFGYDDISPSGLAVKDGETTIEVDISSLSGSYYITLFAYNVEGGVVTVSLE